MHIQIRWLGRRREDVFTAH